MAGNLASIADKVRHDPAPPPRWSLKTAPQEGRRAPARSSHNRKMQTPRYGCDPGRRARHAHEIAQGQGAAPRRRQDRWWSTWSTPRSSSTPPERIFVVVGHQADEVRRAVTTPGDRLHRADRAEGHRPRRDGRPRGAGRARRLPDDPLRRLPAAARRDAAAADRRSEPRATPPACCCSAMMDDPTGYGRVIRDAHGRVAASRRAEGRHAGATRHPRSQHGHLLLPRRPLLEARGRDPPRQSGARILPDRHGRDPQPRRTPRRSDADRRRARSARHQQPRRTGRSRPPLARAQSARADAGRRHHRKARDRHHRRRRARSAWTPSSSRSRRSSGNTTIGENCRIGACSIVRGFRTRGRRGDRRRSRSIGDFAPRARRARRALRAAAHGEPRGGRRAHRQLRGAEEDAHGRGREGQPPGVPRRFRRSAPR